MAQISLPIRSSYSRVAGVLASFSGNADDERLVEILVPARLFLPPAAVALLCAWGMYQIQCGFRFSFSGDQDAIRYLSRINLLRCLEADTVEDFTRHPDAGRLVPLHSIEKSSDCLAAMNAMGDLVIHQFDNARQFFPAMEWAAYEVMDNIHTHSEMISPGFVCAQFFPEAKKVQVGICDMGRGIRASLSTRYPELLDDGAAIAKSLERGVTRDPAVGQGNGLAGTCEIARANGGQFHLWSGASCYRIGGQDPDVIQPFPLLRGTGIHLSLDADKPVDLANTFIGRDQLDPNESIYLNAEEERACDQGLMVAIECVHTGGRLPASGLRRKINALLVESWGPTIRIDFSGVTTASSSFLDELLGRLLVDLGRDKFKNRILVVNITDRLLAMARVVMKQRWLSHSAESAKEHLL